jgi:hypothetical protein
MKRLQISLEPELDADLERAAMREGVSKAEIVRRGIRREVNPLPPIEEDPIWDIVGMGGGKDRRPGETIDDIVYGPRD